MHNKFSNFDFIRVSFIKEKKGQYQTLHTFKNNHLFQQKSQI